MHDNYKSEEQTVELRHRPTDVLGIIFLFGFLGITAMLKADLVPPHQGIVVWIPRFMGLFCLVYGGINAYFLIRYIVAADARGIKWCVHGRNYEIKWENIKVIHVRQDLTQEKGLNYSNLLLISFRDEEIGNVDLFRGYAEEKQRLIDFITKHVQLTFDDSAD